MKVSNASQMSQSFWSMNEEMNPRNKVTFVREIDVTKLDKLREKFGKLSYTSLITKAAACVLKEFPYANRAIMPGLFGQRLVQFENADITVAVEKNVPDAEAVVYAHILRDVQSMSSADIYREMQKLVDSNSSEKIQRWLMFLKILKNIPTIIAKRILRVPRYFASEWVKHRGGACFINSPAKHGIDLLVADMLWPLTFSFGWVRERPWVVENQVVVRKTVPLIMIFDRRIMQGALAGKAFNRFCNLLENADELALMNEIIPDMTIDEQSIDSTTNTLSTI
ncbi:MAG: 2-oxo acid dehydrogenase subunit E2 [Bdellovibrionaceae bacterium]|nr:2-oxo acid dehydrogenase subunit E2 [Pseudobdellovibrionaceae bacterium]NUM59871.1 2-oxo acid dehydrogenase subunit E2 [Pseudobdellovibrionaceae bacterium]